MTKRASKKKLTPKQRVLRYCPDAVAYKYGSAWVIQSQTRYNDLSGICATAVQAWASAAGRLP